MKIKPQVPASIKKHGDTILDFVRRSIKEVSKNKDQSFLINRWIYARLQKDERGEKELIKNQLYKERPQCFFCKEKFLTKKGVHLHRVDQNRAYHGGNSVITCKECHDNVHGSKSCS